MINDSIVPAVNPLTVKEFQTMVAKEPNQVLIVDVRHEEGFRISHIPGAINLPISMSDFAYLKAFREVPNDRPIVVYCQSENCKWAIGTAERPLFRRFTNLSILSGGINEYDRQIGK
jgi:rhodanese-related sulfurtransferase